MAQKAKHIDAQCAEQCKTAYEHVDQDGINLVCTETGCVVYTSGMPAGGDAAYYAAVRRTRRFAHRHGIRIVQEPCQHDWQEQPGEPPSDVCCNCGAVRE